MLASSMTKELEKKNPQRSKRESILNAIAITIVSMRSENFSD